MTAATRALAVLVVAAVGACFNPQYDQPSCRMTGECPAGLRCDGEVCRLPADLIDAGDAEVIDAAGDAEVIDAAGDAEVIDAVDAPDGSCVPIGEVCNGLDDDCDQRTDESFPTLGTGCDGADGDACVEGAVVCRPDGAGVVCNDQTSTTIETCNVQDDDCDLMVDEGFDLQSDASNCGLCNRVCMNGFGTTSCSGSTCVPVCSAGAQDCDGNPVNGCELRNTNPVCAGATSLGSLRGDAGSDTVIRTGFGEAFFRITVSESVTTAAAPILAQVSLASPAGTNFDLFVTCATCGGALSSSTSTGIVDNVNVGRDDIAGDQTYDLLIEVRFVSASACANWTLTINGNVATPNRICN